MWSVRDIGDGVQWDDGLVCMAGLDMINKKSALLFFVTPGRP